MVRNGEATPDFALSDLTSTFRLRNANGALREDTIEIRGPVLTETGVYIDTETGSLQERRELDQSELFRSGSRTCFDQRMAIVSAYTPKIDACSRRELFV